MRKILKSNLLLLMFLVGAASGFLVSVVGWGGLKQSAQHFDHIYASGTSTLKKVSDTEMLVQRSQAIFLGALRKHQLAATDKGALVHTQGEITQHLNQLVQDPASGEEWKQVAQLFERIKSSREQVVTLLEVNPGDAYQYYASETAPLEEQLTAALLRSLPQIAEATQKAYLQGTKYNQYARHILVGMSLLASVFFCLAAWLAYREARSSREKTVQLDREHALFKTLFESTRDAVMLSSDGNFFDCNRTTLKMFGVPSVESFKALELTHLQPGLQPDGKTSANALETNMRVCIASGAQRFEWHFQTMEGKEFPAEVSINTARVGDRDIVQLTVRDITEKKRIERQVMLANRAFENSLEGMTITDADSNILTVNNAFTQITGYAREEVIGRNPRVLSSGRQTRDFYDEMWGAIKNNGKWQGEIWNIRKDGDIYPLWLNISSVVDEHGKVTNYVGVFSDISERKSAEAQLLHKVYYDQWTELPNRMLFTDRLNQVMSLAARRPDARFAVMFIDLDRFKLINDSMGHDAGDQLLQQAAHRLSGSVRKSDTVARMGGDEFTVLLAEIKSPKDACGVAQKILDAFLKPFILNGQEVYVSASIGISIYPEDGNTTQILLKNADMAMYRAKNTGGSWYELYDEGLGTQTSHRLSMETDLHKALHRNEFELYYQPQFDCASNRLLGFEALLRWRHPGRGLLCPPDFISIAEDTGLIVPIGAWVLEQACQQAQSWRDQFPGQWKMAVNLSGRQFQNAELYQQVTTALKKSGLPPYCLELEITESVLMYDLNTSIHVMHELAELGVQFAIDDFGTGHSSLSYLKKLPIHTVKIDGSFMYDIVTDKDDSAIVSAICAMSSKLGLRVIAEGVENKAQLDYLNSFKGVVAQGYLLGQPLTAQAGTRLIAEGRPKAAVA